MKRIFLSLSIFVFFLCGCAPVIYKTKDFSSKTAMHKTVAILPADVIIQLRPREMKNTTAEQIIRLEEQTGRSIQDNMYTWFLKRSNKFKYTVSFQDVSRTNALLLQAGLDYDHIHTKTKDELARLLEVDAVISTKATMEKPMSDGAAIVVGVLIGSWGNTNQVQTSISINESTTGELIWKYDYSASGSVGSSPARLVDNLMRNASKKFPYNKK